MMFGRKDKLALKFMGPLKILKHVGKVAYWLALLVNMDCIHQVFHIVLLRKYISDLTHVKS